MSLPSHRWLFWLLVPVTLGSTLAAQVKLNSIHAVPGDTGLQIEINTSAPVVPTIQQLDSPPRLVIDLPNTRVQGKPERISINNGVIKSIRVDELQDSPPIARVVVDLASSVPYSTHADGVRLLVTFGKNQTTDSDIKPASSASPTFSGSPITAGTSITAGSDTAVLHPARGGEIRVCPGSTISVTPSPNGRDLMLGMNTGALEAHYTLQSSSDSVVTPDFRILFAGPGEFDFAISVDARGNTCVRALPGNNASVIVSELIGDHTYQVKPADQITFHNGHIGEVEDRVPSACGCASPVAPIAVAGPETKPLPPSKPDDIHVTVDAPFVFNANSALSKPATSSASEPITVPTKRETEELIINNRSRALALPDEVSPPPPAGSVTKAPTKPDSPGFFTRVRKFFGSIFR